MNACPDAGQSTQPTSQGRPASWACQDTPCPHGGAAIHQCAAGAGLGTCDVTAWGHLLQHAWVSWLKVVQAMQPPGTQLA